MHWQPAMHGRIIHTIFLGGGTPSILTAAQLEQIFTTAHRCFRIADDCEITSEVNPGVVDRAKFQSLRSLGVNRLSMGVQSFQPEELNFLGRIHAVADVYCAYDAARAAGFDNINLDFMFGLPEQPLANWQDTMAKALALAPEHLSLYSLIVEPNTPLHHWVQTGRTPAPDDDLAADHYEDAIERLAAAGYQQYEVSNWARGDGPIAAHCSPRLACAHNLVYWRNEEYLGIGPGAHSHLRRIDKESSTLVAHRWGNRKSVPGYIKRIHQGDSVEEFCETPSVEVAMGETMMLGLRLLREGVTFQRFLGHHDKALDDHFATELSDLQSLGLITVDAERVRLSKQGLMMGNRVFAHFLPDAET